MVRVQSPNSGLKNREISRSKKIKDVLLAFVLIFFSDFDETAHSTRLMETITTIFFKNEKYYIVL